MSIQNERIKEQIKTLAGKFLAMEGNKSSLLTVTNVEMSKDGKSATILFTAFPAKPNQNGSVARLTDSELRDSFEKTALKFAKRKRSELKQFIKENVSFGRIPFFDFAIDMGEKNRQKIDEISNQK